MQKASEYRAVLLLFVDLKDLLGGWSDIVSYTFNPST